LIRATAGENISFVDDKAVRKYIERLVTLGRSLGDGDAAKAATRREYVRSLVALAEHLDSPAPEPNLDAFRKIVMPNVDAIMRVVAGAQFLRFRALDATNRMAIDALGDPIDLLGLLGRERDEVAHTQLLANFLNTTGSAPFPELARHCGDALEALLKSASAEPTRPLGLGRASAQSEMVVGSLGRVDLVLKSPLSVVFVEAKIDAEERDSQLDDYGQALETEAYGNVERILVFLTARQEQRSNTKRNHIHITFADLMLSWLPLASSSLPGAIDLRKYLKTIAVHICGIASRGSFDQWPTHVQRECLEVLEKRGTNQ